jgi:hypothetical protein
MKGKERKEGKDGRREGGRKGERKKGENHKNGFPLDIFSKYPRLTLLFPRNLSMAKLPK